MYCNAFVSTTQDLTERAIGFNLLWKNKKPASGQKLEAGLKMGRFFCGAFTGGGRSNSIIRYSLTKSTARPTICFLGEIIRLKKV